MNREEEFCTCDSRTPAPRAAEATVQKNRRAVLQISAVHLVKAEHGEAPTMLTAAYKGWWQTPKVHLLLELERVTKAALRRRQQQQPGVGLERLEQWFPWGRGPTLRVKGSTRTLVLRLYTRRRLTARAEVPLGELLSRTAEGVASVPLEVKDGGVVQQILVKVAQVSPHPTPLPPPICPLRFFSQDNSLPPHQPLIFPQLNPTPFRLKQLVRDMYGPPLDDTDWSKPFQFSHQSSDGDTTTATSTSTATNTTTSTTTATSTATSTDGPEAPSRDASRTDGDAAQARHTRQNHQMLPGKPAPRSVPPSVRCRWGLRFVLICLWVLAGYKIITDLPFAVQQTVHWAFDTTQNTELGLA